MPKRRFLPKGHSNLVRYRGRFAPSPTGPLHFGSLVAAVGSYLDAKHHHGQWLVRIEDLDAPRTVKGAAEDILTTLEAFGLHWDEDIIYQSQRTAAYEEAFQRLQEAGAVYPCSCTRKEVADSALHGIDGQIYPGTCRNGIPIGREGRAWRIRTDLDLSRHSRAGGNPAIQYTFCSNPLDSRLRGNDESQNESGIIEFDDALQGGHPDTVRVSDGGGMGGPAAAPAIGCFAVTCHSRITQHLENEVGDFVVLRADGLFAYQFAVVVDDAFQGITHVVRGADLLYSTPRQIYLQRLLGLNTPAYMHLPVAVNAQGEKLSKQTLAQPVAKNNAASTLFDALVFLRQQPPVELRLGKTEQILAWAIANWQPEALLNRRQITAV